MPEFADEAEARSVLDAILMRHDEIAAELDLGPEGPGAIFRTSADGETRIAEDWAEGFFDAIELRPEAWAPLIQHGKAGIFPAPILAPAPMRTARHCCRATRPHGRIGMLMLPT